MQPRLGGACVADFSACRAAPTRGGLEAAATAAVARALEKESGDILCFLPGAGEIRQAVKGGYLCAFTMALQAAKTLAWLSLTLALGLRA